MHLISSLQASSFSDPPHPLPFPLLAFLERACWQASAVREANTVELGPSECTLLYEQQLHLYDAKGCMVFVRSTFGPKEGIGLDLFGMK